MLQEFPNQLIVGEMHVGGDLWEIPFTTERGSFYGVSPIPDVRIDGSRSSIGAGSCGGAASAYRNLINARLNETGGVSPVGISGIYSDDGTTISLSATFEKLDPVTLSNTQAFLLVMEDHLFYSGTEYNHVVRKGQRQAVTLTNVGDEAVVNASWPITGWNMNNIDCVAFLQNYGGNREIYQAARLPRVADFTVAFDQGLRSVPDGNGTVEFHGIVTNIGTAGDQLTFSLNNTWGWTAQFKMEGEAGFHSTPVTLPFAPGADLEVWVRVTTDASVRIGTGSFNTQSANSGRTQPMPLRVFNGSPAVLVVDTDGNRTDETVVLSALTAGGYLYDHWDAYNGHADGLPTVGNAAGYDILLYHQGWNNDGLTAAAQTTIAGFMDSGGGVILSGQDYLNDLTAGPFTSNYLGVASWVVNQDADEGHGTTGDPIGDGMSFALTYPQWNLDRADNLTASATGTIFMLSEESDRIAVRNDNGITRSVFCAFALNAMPAGADPNNVKTLLGRSIDWIMETNGASVDEPVLAGFASGVREVGPNPFAPWRGGSASATIRLRISDAAADQNARLDVVDLNGRLVRNLVNGPLAPGQHLQDWDGRDATGQPVGAGIYYVRFSNSEGSNGARLVVLH
jgi:hypothetical protein